MLSLPRLEQPPRFCLQPVSPAFFTRPKPAPETGPAWEVANLQGAPRATKAIAADQAAAKTHVGQTIVTSGFPRFLSQADLGEIRIDPNSRVRLVQTDLIANASS
jgi:hypothetical protein